MKKLRNTFGLGLLGLVVLTGCSSTSATGSNSTSTAAFDKTQSIVPYTRDCESGTREGFMEKIGLSACKSSNAGLRNSVQEVTGNGGMLTALQNQQFGIGYFSADSISEAKTTYGLKILSYEGTEATETSILDGSYELSRNFNYCYRNETDATKKLIVEAFVAYMGSQEGLAIIKANGGTVSIPATTKTWNQIKTDYVGIDADHSSISIKFGGSTSVQKIALALTASFKTLAGNFTPVHNHTGSGAAYGGVTDEASTLDVGFASRDFKLTDSEPLATGYYGKVCVDGIVVGVSNKNPLSNITAAQAKSIYDATSEKGTTWSDFILD
ncbi:MAG: substrate-binding domain-containing protein [Bacilli bacterium]